MDDILMHVSVFLP